MQLVVIDCQRPRSVNTDTMNRVGRVEYGCVEPCLKPPVQHIEKCKRCAQQDKVLRCRVEQTLALKRASLRPGVCHCVQQATITDVKPTSFGGDPGRPMDSAPAMEI